jgi:hypothetical protein
MEGGSGERQGEEVVQIIYTHVSECKNDKIKNKIGHFKVTFL